MREKKYARAPGAGFAVRRPTPAVSKTFAIIGSVTCVLLNQTTVNKDKTGDFNLISTSLDLFFSTCKGGKEYTVTNTLASGQTQILIDCSNISPIWIVDNDKFSSELDKEITYDKGNEYVDYYNECPLCYSFTKKEISTADTIKGLTSNTCLDENKNEYCEIDGLPGIYVEKKAFEKKCYENASKWNVFFDNQEEFEDDIFCDKLSLLKKIDDSSVIKDIFGANRMISDDEMKMFFGPNEHSLEMKAVVKNLRRIECKHPLEFDKGKFENIAKEYNKRKEWTMGAMSENAANSLKSQTKIRDIWTDGLSKIFKKNNFYFVHPICFLNHLDKAGLFEFNPYEGKTIVTPKSYIMKKNKNTGIERLVGTPGIKMVVIDNPGFAPLEMKNQDNTEYSYMRKNFASITGGFREDYLDVERGTGNTYREENRKVFNHEGLDFHGNKNYNVISFISGKVLGWGWYGSYGRTVFIGYNSGVGVYLIAHLAKYNEEILKRGIVNPWDSVGVVGGSGNHSDSAYATHLHLSYYCTTWKDFEIIIQSNDEIKNGKNWVGNKDLRNPFNHKEEY